jgi:hypothetical protein
MEIQAREIHDPVSTAIGGVVQQTVIAEINPGGRRLPKKNPAEQGRQGKQPPETLFHAASQHRPELHRYSSGFRYVDATAGRSQVSPAAYRGHTAAGGSSNLADR